MVYGLDSLNLGWRLSRPRGSRYSTSVYSSDSYFEVFGPKDHIMQGYWAILSLGVMESGPKAIL